METRLAILSIIIEDPESAGDVNSLLHEASDVIIGRMGLPYREKGISIISVVIDAPEQKTNALTGSLGRLHGVTAKALFRKQP